jgi:hypothetical protein
MFKDNVSPIKSSPVTIDSVKEAVNAWRSGKKQQSEKIPEDLWVKIAALLNLHSDREVRSALSLTSIQIERGKQLAQAHYELKQTSIAAPIEPIDFCEAQEQATFPLAYKPAEAFATNTSIVELRRPDGMLMKIHICTDRFDELLRAFFKG